MTPRLPKYLELADRIRLDILHGALPAGSVAPSENEVAQCYGVSRLTARRTLNELAQRGLLKRSRGQRSVVLDRVGPHRPVLYAPGQSDAALEYVPGAVYSVSAFRQGRPTRPWRPRWICRWVRRWRMWSAGLGSTEPPSCCCGHG